MLPRAVVERLARRSPATICLIAIEGLGGVPCQGRTALDAAACPCLNRLAGESECGLMDPVGRGITPGRATAFLALLGYDPLEWPVSPAAAEAFAAGRPPPPEDVLRLPTLSERFKLRPAAVVRDPLRRGLAALAGMDLLDPGCSVGEQFLALQRAFGGAHDFFLLHVAQPDQPDETQRFRAQTEVLHAVDRGLTTVLALEPDVIAITGEYTVPPLLGAPSWHPVPFLLWSKCCRTNRLDRFTESACAAGALGRFPSVEALPLMLAHALKLAPLGA